MTNEQAHAALVNFLPQGQKFLPWVAEYILKLGQAGTLAKLEALVTAGLVEKHGNNYKVKEV